MNERNTIQRALVLEAVRGMSNHPTADEVYSQALLRCPTISKATVYRNLNRLADEGDILRVPVANAPDRFDRTSYAHAHFMCRVCGRVYDYHFKSELPLSEELNPGKTVESCNVFLIGHCETCVKKKMEA